MLDDLRRYLPRPVAPPPRPADPVSTNPPAKPAESAPQPAAQGKASDSGLGQAAGSARNGSLMKDDIGRLNGDGDSAHLRLTPEVKAQGNWRGLMVGGKAHVGADIRVTQNGEGPDATYTVRYDKQALAALTGEAGTDTAGKGGTAGKAAGGNSPANGRLKLEAGGQSFDVVEMTFSSKEDAIRATETLQKLTVADAMGDGADLAISQLGPMGAPLRAVRDATSGGGHNPLGNPVNKDGAPGRLSQKMAGVSDADMAFLKDNVSAYETTIGTRGRLAAEVKGDMKYFNLAGEGRLDETRRITRRVEMPTADKDGSVTYTMQAGLNASAKERAQKGFKTFGLPVDPKIENLQDVAGTTGEISLRYKLPKGQDVATSAGGRPVPEADALSGNGNMTLDSVSLKQQIDYRTEGLHDPSRADLRRYSGTVTVDDPAKLGEAAGQFFAGDYKGAARTAGARVDLQLQDVAHTGVHTQTGAKISLGGAVEVDASVIYEAGTDDVTVTGKRRIEAPAEQPDQTPQTRTEMRIPPAPADDGKTMVVTPVPGARLRGTPDGDGGTVVQNGTFLRDEGQRKTDASGQEWTKVSGTDVNDDRVEGWVRSDTVRPHSSATGAMDATGRINPTLDYQRHDAIKVGKDDNLWDLAEQHGVDPQQMIALNRDHLLNPSLVFKGDTVYLPGTERGPKPEKVEVPVPQPGGGKDSGSGKDTGSGTGTDSGKGTGSGPETGSAPGSQAPQPGGSTQKPAPGAKPDAKAGQGDTAGRPDLDRILRDYQVKEDERVMFTPNLGPLPIDVPGMAPREMNKTEADLLDKLGSNHGLLGLKRFSEISSNDPNDPGLAYKEADKQFPREKDGKMIPGAEDGHNDAFRHAYWNALMSDRFGSDFAAAMATAHEGVPGNPGAKEAMDLYNNEVGRRIAAENPDASDEELAGKVADAVKNGEMLVIDRNGNLAWSDQVAVGETGSANGAPLPGDKAPPAYESN